MGKLIRAEIIRADVPAKRARPHRVTFRLSLYRATKYFHISWAERASNMYTDHHLFELMQGTPNFFIALACALDPKPPRGCSAGGEVFGHVGPVRPEHADMVYAIAQDYLIRTLNALERRRDRDVDELGVAA